MKNVNAQCLSGADTGNVTGIQLNTNQWMTASFHAYFGDATATGTLKVQISNDPCPYGNITPDFTATNWVDLPNATAAVTAGSSAVISVANCAYRWMRLVYTRTSGGSTTVTGNVNAIYF